MDVRRVIRCLVDLADALEVFDELATEVDHRRRTQGRLPASGGRPRKGGAAWADHEEEEPASADRTNIEEDGSSTSLTSSATRALQRLMKKRQQKLKKLASGQDCRRKD